MIATTAEADRQWSCEQINAFGDRRLRYEKYAETLRQVLGQAARHYAPDAIVQARAKTIASFAEKIQRKKDKYADPVNQFTDLCGGRVITHTPDEVKAICAFIEQHFEIDWLNTIDVSQRLKPTEFGYRSVHYIIKFKPGVFPNTEIPVEIPPQVFDLKAEIQVRTILEHAWADFNHRLVYKSAFPIPSQWQREFAGMAAMLEEVDKDFARIEVELRRYAATYGSHLSEQQTHDEIALLETVLTCDPDNDEVAGRIGKLAITLGDWQKAIDTLSPHARSGSRAILRDLGVAIYKQEQERDGDPHGARYRKAQAYLEQASAPPAPDLDALAALAGSWKGVDDQKAREYYRQAYELAPSDPYPFGNYLESEVVERRDTSPARLLTPAINTAIQRCRDQADVGMNLPWAFYDMGKFNLLLGECYESLTAYAKAIQVSSQDWMIETSLRSVERLADSLAAASECEWPRRLLLLGWAAKFPAPEVTERVAALALASQAPIAGPVVILAGGCDADTEPQMQGYRQLLVEAFRDFRGTLICGGTTAGISGLAGGVQQAYPTAIHAIGYLPEEIPAGVVVDNRYRELRRTASSGFSPLEPLQYWIDLVASGIRPDQVKLLGINGGAISAAEYRLALALGARVAVIAGSGRAVADLLADNDWRVSGSLVALPPDATTVEAFIGQTSPELAPTEMREAIARAIHEAYSIHQAGLRPDEDPSLAEWFNLWDALKESNRLQADHIPEKLRRIGCFIDRATGREVALLSFTDEEIEIMAEMEHARWVVERLAHGWSYGVKRDPAAKTNPYLVPWPALPESVKEQDRETVRRIPEFLAKVGWEVRRFG